MHDNKQIVCEKNMLKNILHAFLCFFYDFLTQTILQISCPSWNLSFLNGLIIIMITKKTFGILKESIFPEVLYGTSCKLICISFPKFANIYY